VESLYEINFTNTRLRQILAACLKPFDDTQAQTLTTYSLDSADAVIFRWKTKITLLCQELQLTTK